jgi:glycosyltransferase involved in cell wall biosynthesis
MNKLKIGFDTFVFRMQEYGGMSTMYESIFKNLTTVEVVFLEKVPQKWASRLNTFSYRYERKTRNSFFPQIAKRMSFNKKSNDVRIVHLTYYKKESARSLDQKLLVLTICDFIPERFPTYFESNPHADKIELIRKADMVFCISRTTAEDLKYFVPDYSGKIVIAPLASKFPLAESESSKPTINNPDKPPYLLYVGRRDAYKNTDILLRFIEMNTNYDLVLFGGGHLTPTEKLILGDNGAERTRCISGDDVILQELYMGANCLIYPSHWEGFGLPILEALSLGCPVICSKIKVFEELFDDGVEYFDSTSIESLVNSVDSLNRFPERRIDLSTRGFKINQKYSWLITSQIIQNAYLDLDKSR